MTMTINNYAEEQLPGSSLGNDLLAWGHAGNGSGKPGLLYF